MDQLIPTTLGRNCRRLYEILQHPVLNDLDVDESAKISEVRLQYISNTAHSDPLVNDFRRIFTSVDSWKNLEVAGHEAPQRKLKKINNQDDKGGYFVRQSDLKRANWIRFLSNWIFKVPSFVAIFLIFTFFLFLQSKINGGDLNWWHVFAPAVISNMVLLFQVMCSIYLHLRHPSISALIIGVHKYLNTILDFSKALIPICLSMPTLNIAWFLMLAYKLEGNSDPQLSWYDAMIPHWILLGSMEVALLASILFRATFSSCKKSIGNTFIIQMLLALVFSTEFLICRNLEGSSQDGWWTPLLPTIIFSPFAMVISLWKILNSIRQRNLHGFLWAMLYMCHSFSLLWLSVMIGCKLDGTANDNSLKLMFIPLQISILFSPIPSLKGMLIDKEYEGKPNDKKLSYQESVDKKLSLKAYE